MNRRDFFKTLTAAIVASSAGFALLPEQAKLLARHIFAYDIHYDYIVHRLDVWVGKDQFMVDFASNAAIPTEEEMRPALEALEARVGNRIEVPEGQPYEEFLAKDRLATSNG